MGIHTQMINAYGAKFYLDDESEEKLARLGESFSGDVYTDFNIYYDDEDIVSFLEEVVFKNTSIDIVWFGNMVCDTNSDPMGIIISPKTEDDKIALKKALLQINSDVSLKDHQEIVIG